MVTAVSDVANTTAVTDHALYRGRVVHQRHGDLENRFEAKVTMAWLNLDELGSVGHLDWRLSAKRGRPLQFRRSDFHGDPAISVAEAVRATVKRDLDIDAVGPICVLANLRLFGWNFNPLATYYCFDATGSEVIAMILEVTNTPWGQRHSYVVGAGAAHRVEKVHHVSPFLEMDLTYDIATPMPGSSLSVRFSVRPTGGGPQRFAASVALRREALSAASIGDLVRHPWRGAPGVSARIYVEAARLAAKRAPFFVNPTKVKK